MAARLPNGSTFDFAATFGTEVVVSSITNANPAVATATGHSVAVGDVVLLTTGWVRATGRAFRVSAVNAGTTITLEGLDTTDTTRFPIGSSAGSVKEVATWVTVSQITEATSSGGEQQFVTFGYLENNKDQQLATTKSPAVLTLVVADDPTLPYVPVVEKADSTQELSVQRLNLIDGSTILYVSVVSITATPTLSRNNIMNRTITLSQQGDITRYLAA